MKKIIALFLVLLLILTMTVPAYAVTPPLETPASPTVPDVEVHIDVPDSAFEDYIPDINIAVEIPEVTEAPSEPAKEPTAEEACAPNWHDWFRGWYSWWLNLVY